MVGYIYETTNLINNKKYIGKRISNTFLQDKYLGSGVLLKKAIQKYGKDNFNVKLIETCDDREELIKRETYWIKYYDAVESNMYYNLSYGNEGHAGKGTYKHSQQCKDRISKSNKGKIRTLENKQKISNTLKRQHRVWLTNSIEEHNSLPDDVDKYISRGFTKGRLPMSQEQKLKQSKVYKEKLSNMTQEEINNRFGRHKGIPTSDETKQLLSKLAKGKNNWTKGRKWIHKDNNKRCIKEEELDYYLSKGWHKGMYKDKCKLCSSTTIESIV